MKKILLLILGLFILSCGGGGDEVVCATGIYDCAGECNGDAAEDCAGECNGTATVQEDQDGTECGCSADNLVNEEGCCGDESLNGDNCCGNLTIDCMGTCGGVLENDCNGTCGGNAEYDCSGVCDGDDDIDSGVCDCSGTLPDENNQCTCSGVLKGEWYNCNNECMVSIDCFGECGGDAVVDECGECDGPGSIYACGCDDIPEGNCDCDGNVLNCIGECGASIGEIAEGCDLPENTLYLLDNGSVLYNSTSDIAGFQFDIMGACAPEGGSGGAAQDAGLTVSGGSIVPCTVIGFSLTGAVINAGCGTLTTLALDEDAIGLSDIVFSNPDAESFILTYCTGE